MVWTKFYSECGGDSVPRSSESLLVSRAGSWGSWLRGPICFRVGVHLLVGRANAQGILGLVFTYWCVKPCPGASASPVAESAPGVPCCRAQESQSWCWPAGGQGQGPGNAGCRVALVQGLGSLGDKTCPRASTSPLLGRAGSWDLWLQSSGSWSLNRSAGGQGQFPGCP